MKRAADFRAEARAALKGHWRLAVGVGFLAMVLGGIAGVGKRDNVLLIRQDACRCRWA